MTGVCDSTKMAVNIELENASFSDGQTSLEDSSVVNSSHQRSWFDMMEEEADEEKKYLRFSQDDVVIKTEPELDQAEDDLRDEIFMCKTTEVKETIVKSETCEEHVTEAKTVVNVKLEPKREEKKLLFSDILKKRLQNDNKKSPIKSPIKLEENSSSSQGLISDLMNNIDGFHMITPIKQEYKVENVLPDPIKLKGFDSDEEEDVLDVTAEEEQGFKNEPEENFESLSDINKAHPFRKRMRDSSSSSHANSDTLSDFSPKRKKRHYEIETDPAVLARRQKQIDYGKNTIGYDRYLQVIPKNERKKHHPKTPPKHLKYSRRAWDGIIKVWRQQLHFWDSPNTQPTDSGKESCSDLSSTITTSNGSERKPDESSDSEEQSLDDSLLLDDGFSDL